MAATNSQEISYEDQRRNIVQLSRDRKNGVGGYAASLKDFAEMGPPSGEHWPLSAEQIRRAFGVPANREDPESPYVQTERGESHVLLERAARQLRRHVPHLYEAWNSLYSPDLSGDRDYDWVLERARKGVRRRTDMDERICAALEMGYDHEAIELFLDATYLYTVTAPVQSLLERCNLFLDLLTLKLLHRPLIAQFGARIEAETKSMGEQNGAVWDQFMEYQAQGMTEIRAREQACKDH